MFIMASISFIMDGFIVQSLAFLLLMPDYTCYSGGLPQSCSAKETCQPEFNHLLSDGRSGLEEDGYLVDTTSPTTLDNWIGRFNLRCSKGWEIGFFGAAFFLGYVVGIFFLAKRGDVIGRIPMMRFGLTCSAVIYLSIVLITFPLEIHYFLIFAYGFFANIRTNISYLYGQETILEKHQTMMGTLLNCFDSCTMVIVALYFSRISQWWFPIQFSFVIASCLCAGITWILPESPKYLIAKGSYKDAKIAFL